MNKQHYQIIKEPFYKNYLVNQSYQTTQGIGLRSDILDRAIEIHEHMLQKYTRVFYVRFDIRYPRSVINVDRNKLFVSFLRNYKRRLKYKGYKFSLLWCTEQHARYSESNDTGNRHYHVALYFKGADIRKKYKPIKLARECWLHLLGLQSKKGYDNLVWDCEQSDPNRLDNGVMLDREDVDYKSKCDEVFFWTSYLSKMIGKRNMDSNAWDSSVLP